MALHQIVAEQFLPISREEAWNFLSSPLNLSTITPDYMGFEITSEINKETKMYSGMIITYKVRPLLGIPMNWVTEIKHVEQPIYFVDEQRHGPYKMWHHKHFIEEVEGGVIMKDQIHYRLPLGFLGDLANWMFVKKQLKGIFDYREKKLNQIFPKVDSVS